MSSRDEFLLQALDAIERCEVRLLIWGYVDGFLTQHDLAAIVDPLLDAALQNGATDYFASQDVIADLVSRNLILSVDRGGEPGAFRSRMAETLRLLARLRQLLPKHAVPDGWQRAPTLVSDFRLQWRPRTYPRRDKTVNEAVSEIRGTAGNGVALSAVKATLRAGGDAFRLAAFQIRATARILSSVDSEEALGTIICAGTGSGKTLAFYLPALSTVVRRKIEGRTEKPWVKVVALYPRVELLKDQVREVLKSARAVESLAGEMGGYVRIGVLFGETPESARYCDNWRDVGGDLICPITVCTECAGELRWRRDDRASGLERLTCTRCGAQLGSDRFVFTRKTLRDSPPDVLFTTTEMLNQRLSDNSLRHLFGVGPRAPRRPDLVLMDEVHTYDGRHGAHVSYLMRRWQHLLEARVNVVALSATLRDPSAFLAALTGLRQDRVQEISPATAENETEGAEYLVALRGDPVSRTALLSTTIQSAMVIARMLDPRRSRVSQGAYGTRAFAFADNLDVTNRLYFDLQSAEGRDSWGRPDLRRSPQGGLAFYRQQGTSLARYRFGQDWRASEVIGHDLAERLRIERVSSQDRGVDPEADIVVATAALEVGFDDPTVGAVIQHKAPRNLAGFVQRKGRAGRARGMRPWTLVVLSDYGRDRVAYQNYDALFEPTLPPKHLPTGNRYVQRIQAVYALIDYLGTRMQASRTTGNVWRDLSDVASDRDGRHDVLARELCALLEDDEALRRFSLHLKRALRLSKDDVDRLLWEYPRPLLTAVIPTAIRRLASGWRALGVDGADVHVRNNPLPDFAPASLFSDLNLAETNLVLPAGADAQTMPVLNALREFAPGRVSRRYGIQSRTERHWLCPPGLQVNPAVGASQSFDVDLPTLGSFAQLGEFNAGGAESSSVVVFQPTSFVLNAPPAAVTDSSNARLLWQSQFVALGSPLELAVPKGGRWAEVIPRLSFFMHSRQGPVEVRRFATGSDAEITFRSGQTLRAKFRFMQNGCQAGVGTAFAADGIKFSVRVPEDWQEKVSGDHHLMKVLRAARYFSAAWTGEVLTAVSNPFMRQWLAQIYLSAVTYEAIRSNSTLEVAATSVCNRTSEVNVQDVLELIFQSAVVDDQGVEQAHAGQDRLRTDLVTLLGDSTVLNELHTLMRLIWEPIGDSWTSWLRKTFFATVSAALVRGIVDLAPDIDADDLAVDIQEHDEGSDADLWVTEKSPGGSGLIEEILRVYSADPRRYFSAVRAAVEMTEFEAIDSQLVRLFSTLAGDDGEPVVEAIRKVREARTFESRITTYKEMRTTLREEHYSLFHGFLSALNSRVLRPGAGLATDRYVNDALTAWQAQEDRLGIEIDLRIVSYWLAQTDRFDGALSEAGLKTPEINRTTWRMNAIYGLLWARGPEIRNGALVVRTPYAESLRPERMLLSSYIGEGSVRVSMDSPTWLDDVLRNLGEGCLVKIGAPDSQVHKLAEALQLLITNPVETGYLRAFARIHAIRREGDRLEAEVELPEAVQ